MKIYLDQAQKILKDNYWKDSSLYKKPVRQEIEAFLNVGNNRGHTCLHYASVRGNVDMLQYLESLGANINAISSEGQNLFHSAAEKDQLPSFLYFNQKLDLNAVDNKNWTVLHEACSSGSESVVEYLLAQ